MAKEAPLKASQRFSNTTPEGLRLRVLSAIPDWERIPRKIRQAMAMLPVYGDWEEACDAVGADPKKTQHKVKLIVDQWLRKGVFPDQVRTVTKRKRGEKRETQEIKSPLTQAEMLQQLANEMASIALIKAEGSMRGGDALKLAEKSGWFLNIEAEVEKSRAYTDARIGKAIANLDKGGKDESSDAAKSGVPEFEQDMDVDDDFTGETDTAKSQSEPESSAPTDEHGDGSTAVEGDGVQAVSVAGEGS